MTMNLKTKNVSRSKPTNATKYQQVIDLLSQDSGASLEDLSAAANWLPHSTSACLTGLKKKGYAIASEKTEGIRRYRATPAPSKSKVK